MDGDGCRGDVLLNLLRLRAGPYLGLAAVSTSCLVGADLGRLPGVLSRCGGVQLWTLVRVFRGCRVVFCGPGGVVLVGPVWLRQLCLSLVAGLLAVFPSQASAAAALSLGAQLPDVASVPVSPVAVKSDTTVSQVDAAAVRSVPVVSWPAGGVGDVAVTSDAACLDLRVCVLGVGCADGGGGRGGVGGWFDGGGAAIVDGGFGG